MENVNELFERIIVNADKAIVNERQKTEPFKDMFSNEPSIKNVLVDLLNEMSQSVFDANDILEKRHNISLNQAEFNYLLALPFIMYYLDKKVGEPCSIDMDKAFFLVEKLIRGENG